MTSRGVYGKFTYLKIVSIFKDTERNQLNIMTLSRCYSYHGKLLVSRRHNFQKAFSLISSNGFHAGTVVKDEIYKSAQPYIISKTF